MEIKTCLIGGIKDQIYFGFVCVRKSLIGVWSPQTLVYYILYITYYELYITTYDLPLTLYPLTQDTILGIPKGKGMFVVVSRTTRTRRPLRASSSC